MIIHLIFTVGYGFVHFNRINSHQYGEGWLIPGEIGSFAKDGVQNILCLQPFGCIANHVIAKGIEKRLKEKYPGLNLLFLDADADISKVNFFNRLYFFVNQAKTTGLPARPFSESTKGRNYGGKRHPTPGITPLTP